MHGRLLCFLAIAALVGPAQCSPSPVDPNSSPTGVPRPAAHLDCDSAEDIRARIDELEADGTLNSGRATALRNKLDQAERWEAEGRPDMAAEAYERLIEQVQGWVEEGTLSEEDMEDLLTCAEDVLDGPDTSFATISAGGGHTCAVTTNGDGYCWGSNSLGQLGDGNAGTDSDIPVAVLGGLALQTISAGNGHTCGVTTTGDGYCWGNNLSGQLGDGNAGTHSDIPVAVDGLVFETISAGDVHTCGVTTAGDAYCWGRNTSGQLGNGNAGTDSDTPVAVSDELSFQTISAGNGHTCGVTTAGDGYCWGRNTSGQVGNDDSGTDVTDTDTPNAVSEGLSFQTISAGFEQTCGLTTSGDAYCWGDNAFGQLGDGNAGTDSNIPVAVSDELNFQTISAGHSHTCGVTTGGDAYCWGSNFIGQLGDGNAGTDSDTPVVVLGGLSFETISAGVSYACSVTTGGDAYCWGANAFGNLGNGNAGTDSDIPVPVASP